MAKLKIFRYAIFQSIIAAFAGLVAGLIYSIGGLFIDIFTIGLNKGTALAFLAILGMPIYFASIGFITGIVGAWAYNLVSKRTKKPNFFK